MTDPEVVELLENIRAEQIALRKENGAILGRLAVLDEHLRTIEQNLHAHSLLLKKEDEDP